ncbi:iron transporter [Aurantimonas sp. VKM B-3413]|uniref:iron transporter n=1 Tax=Aurantimonas sp. VKM B-3413 TaxID=2779401 RepID=UPI001E41B274|nr:iron transporter [Aurantimonas sp. VKM B-3413]MCB8837227.1 iron transporter [Aurantimonas sp. VKM B-3413]
MTSDNAAADRNPPATPSDEADRKQLRLAKEEGAKYLASLEYMANEVADNGGQQHAGDFIVAFAQERAEGMYEMKDGKLEWAEAAKDKNCHMEIAVLDATDHRFVPYLDITCTLKKEGEPPVEFKPQFLWHPGLYHYGQDLKVPGDGTYDLHVAIAAPTFPRHDEVNGKRYGEPVEVTFEKIAITTGRE